MELKLREYSVITKVAGRPGASLEHCIHLGDKERLKSQRCADLIGVVGSADVDWVTVVAGVTESRLKPCRFIDFTGVM